MCDPKEKYEDRNDLGVFDDYEYMDDDYDYDDDDGYYPEEHHYTWDSDYEDME